MQRTLTALLAALTVPVAASMAQAQTPAAGGGARRLEIVDDGAGAYASTAQRLHVRVAGGSMATPVGYDAVQWETSDPTAAWVSTDGTIVFLRAGRVTVTARRGADSAVKQFEVRDNPAARITIDAPARARVGQAVRVKATALDGDGRAIADERVNVAGSSGAAVDGQGDFVAQAPGTYVVLAEAGSASASATIIVDGPAAAQQGERAATRVELPAPDFVAYAGTTVPLAATVWYAASDRPEAATNLSWSTDRSDVATVSSDGVLTALKPGRVSVTVRAGSAAARRDVTVYPNSAARVTLSTDLRDVYVGDSLSLHVDALARGARAVERPHVAYGVTEPGAAGGPHATISADGRFVATQPGVYTIFAAIGDRADQQTILVQRRPAR